MAASSTLADNLRAARTSAGLTQEAAARALGVSKVAVSNWERGLYSPEESRLQQLADLYRTTPGALRYGSENGGSNVSPGLLSEPGVTVTPPRVMAGLPYRVRVWLQEELLAYAKAGASEEEIEDARRLLTSPEVFTFYAGGSPRDHTEDEVLEGMQALAVFIRSRLKKLGRKFPQNSRDR